ncbi:MAG: DUF6702 family protein [Ferruginibacter sp.]
MVHFLFKWLMIGGFLLNQPETGHHPIYVSVTEIEHNARDRNLEISCKIFTDDFETVLRQTYKTQVDLLQPKDKAAMNKLVSDYVQKHLLIMADGKRVPLHFLGYEQDEEGITSYYQANPVATVKKLEVTDNILFEYKKEQINIIHVSVDGKQKSTKLLNPDAKALFEF